MVMYEAFPNFMTSDSLFQKMVEMGAPWTSEVGLSMDVSFFTLYSGLKTPSYFTTSKISPEGVIDSEAIAKILWDIFGKNWQRLWDAYTVEYSPIENYNLQESVKRDQTDDRNIEKTGSSTSTRDGTSDTTYNDSEEVKLVHGETVNTTGEVDEYKYAFNSPQKVPAAVQESNANEIHSGTDTTNTTGDGTNNTTTKDERSDTSNENTVDKDTIAETITRERSGNIGNHSYQNLLKKEFELWKWNFYWEVFDDCDKFLCLSIFDPCSAN